MNIKFIYNMLKKLEVPGQHSLYSVSMLKYALCYVYLCVHIYKKEYVIDILYVFLQIIVGILLVVVGRWNINKRKEQNIANVTNNIIVILIFLVTVVNVLITAFGDDDPDYIPNIPSRKHWSEPRKDRFGDEYYRQDRQLKFSLNDSIL